VSHALDLMVENGQMTSKSQNSRHKKVCLKLMS